MDCHVFLFIFLSASPKDIQSMSSLYQKSSLVETKHKKTFGSLLHGTTYLPIFKIVR